MASSFREAAARGRKQKDYNYKPTYNEDGSFNRSRDSEISKAQRRFRASSEMDNWESRNPRPYRAKQSQAPSESLYQAGLASGQVGNGRPVVVVGNGGGQGGANNGKVSGEVSGVATVPFDSNDVPDTYMQISPQKGPGYTEPPIDIQEMGGGSNSDYTTAIGTGLGLGAAGYGLKLQGGLPTYIYPNGAAPGGYQALPAGGANGVYYNEFTAPQQLGQGAANAGRYYARFPGQLNSGLTANAGEAAKAINGSGVAQQATGVSGGNNYTQLGEGVRNGMTRFSNGMGGQAKLPPGAANVGRFTGNVGPAARQAVNVVKDARGVAYTSPKNALPPGTEAYTAAAPLANMALVGGPIFTAVGAGLYGADENVKALKKQIATADEYYNENNDFGG